MVAHSRIRRPHTTIRSDTRLPSFNKPQTTRTIQEPNLLMKQHLPTILQSIGTIIVAMSISLVSVPLGLGFAGVALVAFGIAAERS